MNPRGPVLVVSRCYNHPEREASARCTACGRYHCRECVAEHDGRMLCGACLRAERRDKSAVRHPGLRRVMLGARVAAAALVVWLCFYALGRALLSVPSDFHEGAVWKGEWWQEEDK